MYRIQFSTLFLATILSCSAVSAQTDSTGVFNNSLKKGSKSLQFRVTNNFSLSTFDGSDISIKRHTGSKSAQRLGIELDLNVDSDKSEAVTNNSFRVRGSESSSSHIGLSINAVWLRYFTPKKRMSFYWGAGPVAGVGFINSDGRTATTFPDSTVSLSESSIDRTSFSVGGILVFGTEFFLHKQISLTGEYRSTSAFYRSSEDRFISDSDTDGNVSNQESNVTSNRFTIGGSIVYMGLSAYF